jgi:hypothetical protein
VKLTPDQITPDVGEILARRVGDQRVAIIPLMFDRVRLVVADKDDHFGYDDGW